MVDLNIFNVNAVGSPSDPHGARQRYHRAALYTNPDAPRRGRQGRRTVSPLTRSVKGIIAGCLTCLLDRETRAFSAFIETGL